MSSYFFFGPPGSGKTTLCARACDIGWNVDLLDLDKKATGQMNLLPYIESGKLRVWTPESPLSGSSLTKLLSSPFRAGKGGPIPNIIPAQDPKGFLELAEKLDSLETNPPEDAFKTILVLDSTSRVNEHLKRFIKYHAKTGKFGFDEWDSQLVNYEELFDCLYNTLQPKIYAHVVVTAHTREIDEIKDKDGTTKPAEIRPLIEGQFRDKVCSLVQEAYYFFVEAYNINNPPKYRIQTVPLDMIRVARTSRRLGTVDDQDPERIFGLPQKEKRNERKNN